MVNPDSAPRTRAIHSRRHMLDAFALCASSLCTVHCLGLPLLFALLPAVATRIDPGESFHVLMLALAVPTSLFALIQGWRLHGRHASLALGISGLAMMGMGAFLAQDWVWEAGWTIGGSGLLAIAHIINWRRGLAPVR